MTYRIVRADIFVVTLPFRFRFRHAAAERTHNETMFIKVTSACGRIGWGETLTRPYLTGETPETVVTDVASWWPEICNLSFGGGDPGAVLAPLHEAADLAGKNAAWSLVDIALYDLWLRGLPNSVSQPSYVTPVSLPVGLGRRSGLLPYVGRLAGFERFKFKVDRSWHDIDGRLNAVRAAAVLAVDANTALHADDRQAVAAWLKAKNIQFIEQPFDAADDDSAASLVRERAASVIADESLCSLADARRIIKARAADGFNIRLAKLGGITGARAVVKLTRQAGLKVQLGALVGETDLLSNAARYCLPSFAPDLFEYAFPGILLTGSPVQSALPRWSARMPAAGFAGTGFGSVDESWLRSRASLQKSLGT